MPSPCGAVGVPDVSSSQDAVDRLHSDAGSVDLTISKWKYSRFSSFDSTQTNAREVVPHEQLVTTFAATSSDSRHVTSQESELNCQSQISVADSHHHNDDATVCSTFSHDFEEFPDSKVNGDVVYPSELKHEIKVEKCYKEEDTISSESRDSLEKFFVKSEIKDEAELKWKQESDTKIIKVEMKIREPSDADIMPPPKVPPSVSWNLNRNSKIFLSDPKFSKLGQFQHIHDIGRKISNYHGVHNYTGSRTWSSDNIPSTSLGDTEEDNVNVIYSGQSHDNEMHHLDSAVNSSVLLNPGSSELISGKCSLAHHVTEDRYDNQNASMVVENFYIQQRYTTVKKQAQQKKRDDAAVTSSISDLGEYSVYLSVRNSLFLLLLPLPSDDFIFFQV